MTAAHGRRQEERKVKSKRRLFSLASRGSRYQVKIVTALIVVLPLLAFVFLALTMNQSVDVYSGLGRFFIAVLALAVGLIGHFMLQQYAENVVRLRQYLQRIAEGELPETVDLLKSETDIAAIETSLNMILGQMRKKVVMLEQQLALAKEMQETIRAQAREILDAERQRVMIQTLGAACHHIGQPATVLRAYLDLLARETPAGENREKLDECIQATEAIADVLERLRKISESRTVPFRAFDIDNDESRDDAILDIGA